MRFFALLLLGACAHAQPSRWVDTTGVYACECEGRVRDPTPGEAADFPEGKSIEAFCEGKVHDCGRYHGMHLRPWDD